MILNESQIAEIESLILNGYISKNKHPFHDLFILSYTKKTSKEALWNNYTLNLRGIIVDKNYKIISYSFKKFFEKSQLRNDIKIPINLKYTITEKLDGALGILYWVNNKPFIASKKKFDSYQALIGNKILKSGQYNLSKLNKNYTYLLEIISPEIRNIIDYGVVEALYLIGAIDNKTGDEVKTNISHPFHLPKSYEYSLSYILSNPKSYDEGFVLRFENGFRLKIKTAEFKKNFANYKKVKALVLQIILRDIDFNRKKAKNMFADNELSEYALFVYKKGISLREYLTYYINNYEDIKYKIPYVEKVFLKKDNFDKTSIINFLLKKMYNTAQYFSESNPYELSIFMK